MAVGFDVGSTIVLRGVMDERFAVDGVVDVRPVTVAADDDEGVVLWCPLGTPTMLAVPLDRSLPRPWLADQCRLVPATWRWRHALLVHAPGRRWSTWVTWSADWAFLGWYVNLQSLLCRTSIGFDDRDHQLDVLVALDRTWAWKDEDDLRRAVAVGQFTADEARAIEQAGHDALDHLAAGGVPFDDDWAAWRPPPEWRIPDPVTDWSGGGA